MKLGEAMIMAGLIDNVTLAKALERQVIFGGRLGTNLVEMGAIPEETLAKFLGKMLGVPYAGPDRFESVPQEVLDSVPAATVEKYLAFPIGRERSRVHLAMKDPNDIATVDELRFVIGIDIKPYIASEIRIVYALEKYYGIKRDLRFVNVLEDEREMESAGTPSRVPGDSAGEVKAAPAQIPAPYAANPPAASQVAGLLEALASPVDTEQIAGVVVSGVSAHLSRVMLLKVKDREVTGWKAGGPGVDESLLPGLRITLDTPSIFRDVVEDRHTYKGPVLPVPQNLALLEALGGGAPLEAVACPLVIKGRVMGVLYGDNGEGSLIGHERMQSVGNIVAKAAMSFEMLLLKQKILSPT